MNFRVTFDHIYTTMDPAELKKLFNPNTTKGKATIAGAAVATLTLSYLVYRMLRSEPKGCPCCTAEYLAGDKGKRKRPKLTYCPDKPKCAGKKDKSAYGAASRTHEDGGSSESPCNRDRERHSDRPCSRQDDCGSRSGHDHDHSSERGSCDGGHHSAGRNENYNSGRDCDNSSRNNFSGSSCPHNSHSNECSSCNSGSGNHSSQDHERQSCRD